MTNIYVLLTEVCRNVQLSRLPLIHTGEKSRDGACANSEVNKRAYEEDTGRLFFF